MADAFVPVTFVADELLTSTKLNVLATNQANFHDGTSIGDASVETRHVRDSAITDSKIDFNSLNNRKKTDANGYTTIMFGVFIAYLKRFTFECGPIAAGNHVCVGVLNYPVGQTHGYAAYWQRTVRAGGFAPFFSYAWESEQLYITNISGATYDIGTITVDVLGITA